MSADAFMYRAHGGCISVYLRPDGTTLFSFRLDDGRVTEVYLANNDVRQLFREGHKFFQSHRESTIGKWWRMRKERSEAAIAENLLRRMDDAP